MHITVKLGGALREKVSNLVDGETIVDVEPGGIEWRQRRSTRPWLAGMVKANNHALLDIGKLVADYQTELSTYH